MSQQANVKNINGEDVIEIIDPANNTNSSLDSNANLIPNASESNGIFRNTSRFYDLSRLGKDESICLKLRNGINQKRKKYLNNLKEKSYYKNILFKRFPILSWATSYKPKQYLLPDLVSGFTVGVMNIPQGMAYSILATLNPINGLYTQFFPVIIYALFGTSRHLAIGAISIVCLLSGAVIDKTVEQNKMYPINSNSTNTTTNDDALRVSIACSLTFLIGLFQVIMGFTGLGAISSYFSNTFISSYTTASAVHTFVSQMKDIFGLKNLKKYDGIFKIPKTVYDILSKIYTLNWITVASSLSCIIFLTVFKEFLNPRIKKRTNFEFPSELLLIIIMTSISYVGDFSKNYNVTILNNIPKGIPVPVAPDIRFFPSLIKDALVISLIAFSISISLAALFSRKNKYRIDSTQELYAYGASNLFSSFFSCVPASGSLSRSSVLDSTHAKTQFASIVSSGVIIIVIVWLGPLFESLPKLCLSSIIVVALKSLLFQARDFFSLWSINKYEWITWVVTFLSVVILDVDVGLFIGIGASILMVLIRDQSAVIKPLAQFEPFFYVDEGFISNKYETNVSIDSKATQTDVKIFKLEHSLYFANCEIFQKNLYNLYGFSPLDLEKKSVDLNLVSANEPDIILDFSAVNYIDTNGIKILQELIEDFKKVNVYVYICRFQESLIQMLFKMKLLEKFDTHLFLTIDEALKDSNDRLNLKINENAK